MVITNVAYVLLGPSPCCILRDLVSNGLSVMFSYFVTCAVIFSYRAPSISVYIFKVIWDQAANRKRILS